MGERRYLWDVVGLEEIGIVYEGEMNPMGLMLASIFQEKYSRVEEGHQISRFFSMRLTRSGGSM